MTLASSHTFLIADLAGFTALTEAHGDDDAADVAEAFIDGMRALLRGHEANEIKTMGDAVLAHVGDAARAICLAECVIGDLGARHGALGVRVGMHSGPAVNRRGDWFGASVNIAARVAGEARADQVLLTAQTVELAGAHQNPAHSLQRLGPRQLRNVSQPVDLYALSTPSALHGVLRLDPVCLMAVAPDSGGVAVVHDGMTVHFCSAGCAAVFASQPQLFAERITAAQ